MNRPHPHALLCHACNTVLGAGLLPPACPCGGDHLALLEEHHRDVDGCEMASLEAIPCEGVELALRMVWEFVRERAS